MPCAQSVKAGRAGSRFVRRSDRRAVERRSWNQNPNEFRHRVADTLARRRLGVLAASCCTPRTAGPTARLSLIAAPIGLGDAPLAARLLVGRLAGRDRVPHPGPPPCSRWYPISGRPRPPPDGQPRAARRAELSRSFSVRFAGARAVSCRRAGNASDGRPTV